MNKNNVEILQCIGKNWIKGAGRIRVKCILESYDKGKTWWVNEQSSDLMTDDKGLISVDIEGILLITEQ